MPTKTKATRKPAARSAEPKEKPPEPTMETAEVPDWVNETPDYKDYSLTMLDPFGSGEQNVQMTRAEFITLKRWLAALARV
jgi:hypothetical protein